MGQFESFIGVNFWTALFVLLNTLAIYFVAKKYLFAPVRRMIESRQAEIDGMYESAANARAQAEELEADYRRKIADAQQTSERMMKEAAQRALRREEEILCEANAQADAILARAAEDAQLEKKQALNDAKNEISAIAVTIAEKVIERELNESDQSALVERFIDALEEKA